jgi:hypothetical protein
MVDGVPPVWRLRRTLASPALPTRSHASPHTFSDTGIPAGWQDQVVMASSFNTEFPTALWNAGPAMAASTARRTTSQRVLGN